MSSRTIQLSSLLYASSKTFLMTSHLALSEKPTMFSGEMTFTKGKLDSLAMYAARAVFPQPALPVVKKFNTFQMMPNKDKVIYCSAVQHWKRKLVAHFSGVVFTVHTFTDIITNTFMYMYMYNCTTQLQYRTVHVSTYTYSIHCTAHSYEVKHCNV